MTDIRPILKVGGQLLGIAAAIATAIYGGPIGEAGGLAALVAGLAVARRKRIVVYRRYTFLTLSRPGLYSISAQNPIEAWRLVHPDTKPYFVGFTKAPPGAKLLKLADGSNAAYVVVK